MKLSDFDYHLPPELIARTPMTPRDHSRLLVVNRDTNRLEHRRFFDIVDYLSAGDVLVINDSKVIPARLLGNKATGGKVELLLARRITKARERYETWECLLKGKHLKPEEMITIGRTMQATLQEKVKEVWLVRFNLGGTAFYNAVEKYGQTPLPPYIKGITKNYKKEYQTVYANQKHHGSVAAPTAGLHFTPALLKRLRAKGVIIKTITLHVGLGTFLPVRVSDPRHHEMHNEWVEVSAAVKRTINTAHKKKKKVIAVGTTSVRALEASYRQSSTKVFKDWVNIFIYPSFTFRVIDGMITNFHVPQSTLLMLVSAFAGRQKILKAYQTAVKERYRFFSFGDAMFLQ